MRRSPIFKGKMPFFSVNSPPFLPVSYLSAYQFSSSLVFFFSCFNVGTNRTNEVSRFREARRALREQGDRKNEVSKTQNLHSPVARVFFANEVSQYIRV